MTTPNPQENNPTPPSKQEGTLFPAFPEPSGWMMNWDQHSLLGLVPEKNQNGTHPKTGDQPRQ
jgi:hypothetical protein